MSTTDNYFTAAVTSGTLTAPSSAASGGNGVYAYGGTSTTGIFPTNTYTSANYWADVVFDSAPMVSAVSSSPATGQVTTGQTVAITLTTSGAVTVTGSPVLLLNDGGTASYDAVHSTATSLVFDYTVPSNQGTSSLSVIGIELPSASGI